MLANVETGPSPRMNGDAPIPPLDPYPEHPKHGRPVQVWVYRDRIGNALGMVCRFERRDGRKIILPYSLTAPLNGTCKGEWKGFPEPRPLYGLDRLAKRPDAPVLIVEGEKAADAAQEAFPDHVAVTSPGGCKSAHKAAWGPLKGRDVTIWRDADEPGRAYALEAVRLAREAGARTVRMVDVPDHWPEKWDLADEPPGDVTAADLRAMLRDAPLAERPQARLKAISLREFAEMEIPPREFLLAPILQEKSLFMIYAERGIGKTHVAMNIGYTVATGGRFLKWEAPKPQGVLYIDGEMSADDIQERYRAIARAHGKGFPENFNIIAHDLEADGIPDLATKKGQDAIEPYLAGVKLVILDNLSTLFPNGLENEAHSWSPVQAWLLDLRRRGIAVLIVHHAGKSGLQRGTSRREDALDAVAKLKRPGDYEASKGARFEFHFEKSRRLQGDTVKPFEARMEVTEDGRQDWTCADLEDAREAKIAELMEGGLSIREIADTLEMPKSTVGRIAKRLNGT